MQCVPRLKPARRWRPFVSMTRWVQDPQPYAICLILRWRRPKRPCAGSDSFVRLENVGSRDAMRTGKAVDRSAVACRRGRRVRAPRIAAARYGAAVLVALADEEGDARSYRRKTSVAARVAGLWSGPVSPLAMWQSIPGLSGTGKRERGRGYFRACHFGLLRCLPRDPATVSAMETVRQDRGCI